MPRSNLAKRLKDNIKIIITSNIWQELKYKSDSFNKIKVHRKFLLFKGIALKEAAKI